MSLKAAKFAEALIKRRYPQTKIFEKGYKPVHDGSTFGLTHPKNIAIANSFFTEMNAEESTLIIQRDALVKEVGPKVPWSFYENYIEDEASVQNMKFLYDTIFDEEALEFSEPFVKQQHQDFADYQALESSNQNDQSLVLNQTVEQRLTEMQSLPKKQFLDKLPTVYENNMIKRIDDDEAVIETEIVPLLNPFGDFWIYQKDGPEFADVFAARPEWNEMINETADDFAYTFSSNQPAADLELQDIYGSAIEKHLRKGVEHRRLSVAEAMVTLNQIADGKVKERLLFDYNENYLAEGERANLKSFREDDNEALATRTGWVSGEVDPMGKHFGGH